MTTFAIRPPTRADLPALVSLINATGLFPEAMLHDMAAPFLAGGITDDLWQVIDDGTITGLSYAAPERMTDGTWNLLLIAVDPQRQRTGIGAALIELLEQLLIARGARLLLVETSGLPHFDGTRAFYQRLGYLQEARIANFYQAGEDKIVFTKALA